MDALVSVLLLSWNHEKYIEQAINSIAEQTYSNIEVIFLDNTSADGTFKIGKEQLIKNNISHKAFQNEMNNTIPRNLNSMLKHASGEYITVLSADDWWEKNNIAQKISYLGQNPALPMVYSGGMMYIEDKDCYTEMDMKTFRRGNIFKDLLDSNFIPSMSVVMKKSVLEELNGWDESLQFEDWDMWLRIAERYSIDYLPENLVFYRKHSNNFSKPGDWSFFHCIEIVKKYRQHPQASYWFNTWADHYMYSKSIEDPSLKNNIVFLKMAPLSLFRFRQIVRNSWNAIFKSTKK